MTRRQQMGAMAKKHAGVLRNDARYWDLCRRYGVHSNEVEAHLRACAEYQALAARGFWAGPPKKVTS